MPFFCGWAIILHKKKTGRHLSDGAMRGALMRFVAAIAVLVSLLPLCAFAAENAMTKDEFLSALDKSQRQVANIELVVSAKRFDIDAETGEPRETPFYFDIRLIMADPAGQRILLVRDSAVASSWRRGSPAGRTVFTFEDYAFDGKIAVYKRVNDRGSGRNTAAAGGSPSQMILPAWPSAELEPSTKLAGLDLVPSFYEERGLAEALRACESWDITPRGPDVYLVRYAQSVTPQVSFSKEVTVDLKRGAVTGVKKYNGPVDPLLVDYELRNVVLADSGGIWLPQSAEYSSGAVLFRLDFTGSGANRNLPKDAFTLTFDPNQRVYDVRTGIRYVPSGRLGWLKHVSSAVLFAGAHKLLTAVVLVLAALVAAVCAWRLVRWARNRGHAPRPLVQFQVSAPRPPRPSI